MRHYEANPLKIAGNDSVVTTADRRYGRRDESGAVIDVEFSARAQLEARILEVRDR